MGYVPNRLAQGLRAQRSGTIGFIGDTVATTPYAVGVSCFFELDVLWDQIMAYSTLITVPVLVMFLAFQRQFIRAIAPSGVKD